MFVQEFAVLFHGTLVAVMQGNNLWPMFAFGFAGIFVITQMHGLGQPCWAKWAIFAIFATSALWIYSGRGWVAMNKILRIPLIEYLAMFILAGIFFSSVCGLPARSNHVPLRDLLPAETQLDGE